MTRPKLVPKLVVRGADEAIAFYQRVFGATLVERYAVRDTVVFARLDLLGGSLTLKEEESADPSPQTLGRPGVLLDVEADDPDALADALVANGGTVIYEMADQPYGARGGRVGDPFGHEWLIQSPITLSPDEVQRRLEEAYG